jgi:predicted RNA-binding protein with PIN domain
MALARILVDGYSLLHSCPQIASGSPRHSAAAREELIHLLTQYADAIGTPVTVFFDGAGAPAGTPKAMSSPQMEILYSKSGKTADDMIERAAHRLSAYGEVLVVTDDFAERDTVLSLGATTSSCTGFLDNIGTALQEMDSELKHHNRRELSRFKRPPH